MAAAFLNWMPLPPNQGNLIHFWAGTGAAACAPPSGAEPASVMGKHLASGSHLGADGFTGRLRGAIERAGGATRIAQVSAIPLSTLHNYLSGRSEPKRQAIATLARVLSLDPWWLLTGEERQTPTSDANSSGGMADPELLATIADGLLGLYREIGEPPNGLTLGRKCGQIHNAIRASASANPDERRTMLRMAIALFRQELLEARGA